MLGIIFVFLVAAFNNLEAAEIECEKINPFGSSKKCCFFDYNTVISANNVTVSGLENSKIDAILFSYNKKIQFLPVNVHERFPSLEFYLAKDAAIQGVSALNFNKLSSLKYLDLRKNQITFIPSDCFKTLIRINVIHLNNNKITTVNGVALANLPQLVMVDLSGNICVNKNFRTDNFPNIFRRRISRNCASSNVVKKEVSCSSFFCDKPYRRQFERTYNRTPSCCDLDDGTYIDSSDYSFDDNPEYKNLEILVIVHQRNVELLPVSVHERFPVLKHYWVDDTPVQKITKKNFEKMHELELLHLGNNQIEIISSDTFEDLISLKEIQILRQRLIALNGEAFKKLLALEFIFLGHNYCINQKFNLEKDSYRTSLNKISNNCGFGEFETMEVSCEKFQEFDGHDSCVMNERTTISSTDFVVADLRDEEVKGVVFEGNKRIEYLPYKIYRQFPNLFNYVAADCAIRWISKENFEHLKRLKSIDLSFNQIQKISGKTFEKLKSLIHVNLESNQIRSINSRTFYYLPSLAKVDLRYNVCIHAALDFTNETVECNGTQNNWSHAGLKCRKSDAEIHYSLKNFNRHIIRGCAYTETGEREFEKVFDIECGVGMARSGFIVLGNEITRGEWPFTAALLSKPKEQFFCMGSIITTSHILTTANCIQQKYSQALEASQIYTLLGRNDFTQAEFGSEIRGVKDIKVHPQWNPNDSKYDGDIAVLEMDQAVQFSEFIQPICLTVEPEISHYEAGYVVGWGRSKVPRQVLISSVNTEVCFAKDFLLGSMFSQGMFCAGGDGFGPCHGDSGAGFFVRYHGFWTLRGIVSSGTTRVDDGGCDVDRFTLFTNILDYTTWINDVVRSVS